MGSRWPGLELRKAAEGQHGAQCSRSPRPQGNSVAGWLGSPLNLALERVPCSWWFAWWGEGAACLLLPGLTACNPPSLHG